MQREKAAQAGFSLAEAAVALGLLAVAVFGAMAAFGGIAKVSEPDPQREAAQRMMARILTLESAAVKYAGPGSVTIDTAPWKTAMPLPGGSTVPMTVSAASASVNGAPAIALTIAYPHNGTTATISKTVPLVQKAPAPQSIITATGAYADPGSAPGP